MLLTCYHRDKFTLSFTIKWQKWTTFLVKLCTSVGRRIHRSSQLELTRTEFVSTSPQVKAENNERTVHTNKGNVRGCGKQTGISQSLRCTDRMCPHKLLKSTNNKYMSNIYIYCK